MQERTCDFRQKAILHLKLYWSLKGKQINIKIQWPVNTHIQSFQFWQLLFLPEREASQPLDIYFCSLPTTRSANFSCVLFCRTRACLMGQWGTSRLPTWGWPFLFLYVHGACSWGRWTSLCIRNRGPIASRCSCGRCSGGGGAGIWLLSRQHNGGCWRPLPNKDETGNWIKSSKMKHSTARGKWLKLDFSK